MAERAFHGSESFDQADADRSAREEHDYKMRLKVAILTDAVKDAIYTLESMDLHVENALYDRLTIALEMAEKP